MEKEKQLPGVVGWIYHQQQLLEVFHHQQYELADYQYSCENESSLGEKVVWLDAPECTKEGHLPDIPNAEKALIIFCWTMSGVREGFVLGVAGWEHIDDEEAATGSSSDEAVSVAAW